jgi:hypothetical protein
MGVKGRDGGESAGALQEGSLYSQNQTTSGHPLPLAIPPPSTPVAAAAWEDVYLVSFIF